MQNTIDISPLDRVIMLLFIIIQYLLFGFSQLLLVNYSSFKLPFLSYPSMLDQNQNKQSSKYLFNIALYLLFWVQHILMATLKYKTTIFLKCKIFILYQRYIYNISSGLCLWFIFYNIQPYYQKIFQIPVIVCIPFAIFGLTILIISMKNLGGRILMPYKISDIINSKSLEYESYDMKNKTGLSQKGIYSILRHPMQSGVLFLLIFSCNIFTLERIIFIVVMGIFVIIGVLMEENRMIQQFADYKQYKKRVPYRFVPFVI